MRRNVLQGYTDFVRKQSTCELCGRKIAQKDIGRYMAGNLKVCRACFNREGKLGEEEKLLKAYSQHKIKYVDKPMGTFLVREAGAEKGTPLEIASLNRYKVRTLNLPPREQTILGSLYRKGLIEGQYLGKGKITKKGKALLKREARGWK
jgi:CRISPR/Cas system-associated protein Cas10 (large subunit of type III CRISPR-Cas system)